MCLQGRRPLLLCIVPRVSTPKPPVLMSRDCPFVLNRILYRVKCEIHTQYRPDGTCTISIDSPIVLSESPPVGGGVVSNVEELEDGRDENVKIAAERLRELKASGVELSDILGGTAGAAFVRDYCEGDPDLAYAAFALAHSTTIQHEGSPFVVRPSYTSIRKVGRALPEAFPLAWLEAIVVRLHR